MKKAALVVLAIVALSLAATAQFNTQATGSAKISAVKGESLSISAVDVPEFTINAGQTDSTSSQNLVITTLWNLTPSRSSVNVCAGATALSPADSSTNPDTISGSAVQISKNSGSTWATLNAGDGCNASNVTVVNTYNLTAQTDRKSQTKIDTVQLKLSGVPVTLQADSYSGNILVYALVQ